MSRFDDWLDFILGRVLQRRLNAAARAPEKPASPVPARGHRIQPPRPWPDPPRRERPAVPITLPPMAGMSLTNERDPFDYTHEEQYVAGLAVSQQFKVWVPDQELRLSAFASDAKVAAMHEVEMFARGAAVRALVLMRKGGGSHA